MRGKDIKLSDNERRKQRRMTAVHLSNSEKETLPGKQCLNSTARHPMCFLKMQQTERAVIIQTDSLSPTLPTTVTCYSQCK